MLHHKTTYRILCCILFGIIIFGLNTRKRLYSYFLIDDEEEQVKDAVKQRSGKNEGLPPDIAYAIKATVISGIQGSVRITWRANPDYKGSFVLARSKIIIDTIDKALSATVIKISKPARDNIYIDPGLKKGEYYYSIVAQEKISGKNIELYPDVNYTSLPVIIKPASTRNNNHVTGLRVRVIGVNRVLLTWNGITGNNIVYSVYRDTSEIATPDQLSKSQKILMLTDKEQYIDNTIPQNGQYYYAVMVSVTDQNENRVFIPDHTYSVSGVYVNTGQNWPVTNIRALSGNGAIEVTWSTASAVMQENIEGFAVYRSHVIIDNQERLNSAQHLGTIANGITRFMDRQPGRGRNYYAVLVKYKNGLVDFRLKRDFNYTGDPVTLFSRIGNFSGKYQNMGNGTVDEILKRTFFQGYYRQAIKELQHIVNHSDNIAEKAKARLFIGRSYIEINDYSTALQYLLHSDVKKYFPKEAVFWRDFATSRIK